jgi:hypothetical protein
VVERVARTRNRPLRVLGCGRSDNRHFTPVRRTAHDCRPAVGRFLPGAVEVEAGGQGQFGIQSHALS